MNLNPAVLWCSQVSAMAPKTSLPSSNQSRTAPCSWWMGLPWPATSFLRAFDSLDLENLSQRANSIMAHPTSCTLSKTQTGISQCRLCITLTFSWIGQPQITVVLLIYWVLFSWNNNGWEEQPSHPPFDRNGRVTWSVLSWSKWERIDHALRFSTRMDPSIRQGSFSWELQCIFNSLTDLSFKIPGKAHPTWKTEAGDGQLLQSGLFIHEHKLSFRLCSFYSVFSELSLIQRLLPLVSNHRKEIMEASTDTLPGTFENLSEGFSKYQDNNSLSDNSGGDDYKVIIDRIQFSMTVIGFIGNVIVLITLHKNGSVFTSPTILRLLKNQSVVDSLVCLIGSIYVLQPPMWKTSNETFSAVVCQASFVSFSFFCNWIASFRCYKKESPSDILCVTGELWTCICIYIM